MESRLRGTVPHQWIAHTRFRTSTKGARAEQRHGDVCVERFFLKWKCIHDNYKLYILYTIIIYICDICTHIIYILYMTYLYIYTIALELSYDYI